MSKWSWKIGIVAIAIAVGSAYAVAQMGPGMHGPMGDMSEMMKHHQQMMQGQQGGTHGPMVDHHAVMGQGQQGMHGGMRGHHAMMGQADQPTMPGQAAFGAIQEVVQILDSDPATDWSKVNIANLREHLIDMDEVTLHAAADERPLDNGIEITVTGDGRTLQAIKRMVPAHAHELSQIGWITATQDLPNGVKFTVTTSDPKQVAKLKALGFMGIMALGPHHQAHHLMMAKGEFHMH
jgi:hypothetical protein